MRRRFRIPQPFGAALRLVAIAPPNASLPLERCHAVVRVFPALYSRVVASSLITIWPMSLRAVGPGGKGGGDNKNGKGDEEKNDKDKEDGDNDDDSAVFRTAFRAVIVVVLVSGVLYYFARPSGEHLSWSNVKKHAAEVVHIDIYHHFAQVFFEDGAVAFVGLIDDDGHTHRNIAAVRTDAGPEKGKNISTTYVGSSVSEEGLRLVGIVAWTIPFFFFPIFALVLTRGMGNIMSGAMSQDKPQKLLKNKMFSVTKKSDVLFKDVAGMQEAKQEVTEIVDFLRKPEHYTKLGAKIPTGALLLGPPGTGKTLLAKAVAGEAGVPFIAATGSDFVELYVGMGALRVRQLFELARQQKDCIIYIDEIDAVGLKRRGAGQGESQEQEHTLNELLTQLDGFETAQHEGRIMVLASSNVQLDVLDPALVRAGRFDRIINVDPPVISERIEIFQTHLNKLRLLPNDVAKEAPPGPSASVPAGAPSSSPAKDATTTTKSSEEMSSSSSPSANEHSAALQKSAVGSVPDATHAALPPPPVVMTTAIVVLSEKDAAAAEANQSAASAALPSVETASRVGAGFERGVLIERYARRMSDLCPGFVGADIMNVCNEAAILAARENAACVNINHLERSIDRVIAGIEMRSRMLSDFERRVVAHHEAGHAIAGWFLNRADPLMKVSIVPRGGKALGYAQYLPSENNLRTAKDIEDSICVTLGGRVAEKIFFGHWSTGASDDLLKVTRMSYHYVASFNASTAHVAPGTAATAYVKPYGAAISKKIDAAAKDLVDRMYQRTYDLLLSKKKEMELLANHLLTNEVLTHQDVLRYLGQRGGRPADYRVA